MPKLDQLAYASRSDADTNQIKEALGLNKSDWIFDKMVGETELYDLQTGKVIKTFETTAKLEFNYDNGIETEILQFTNGANNYVEMLRVQTGDICHVGYHLGDDEDFDVVPDTHKLLFKTVTSSHTSPFLKKTGRKYEYRIYAVANSGHRFVTKYIKRIRGKGE